jgi:hypothetical protein
MESERLIIDRFEGELAVCEKSDRTLVNIPRSRLPSGTREGDVLVRAGENIRIDPIETARRKKAAARNLKRLFRPS